MIFEFEKVKLYYDYQFNNKEQTVVLLHGWGGNHLSLSPLLVSFQNYNILTLDFFGFGQSDKPLQNFDIYSYSNAVAELLKKLNLNDIILVGHSFGGRISIILSNQLNDIVSKMILIDSAGLKPRNTIKKSLKKMKYKFAKFLVKINVKDKGSLEKYGSDDYKKLSNEEKRVFNRVVNEYLEKYLSNIKCSTLIIWGEKDKDTPLYMAKKLNKKIKNSKLYVVKNAGHFAYVEEANLVNKIIKDFLK